MEAVIFVGLQGAGKSTYFKERFFNTHVRLNRDMLKTKTRERLVLDACLKGKQPLVVDNTNPKVEDRAPYITAAHDAGFRVIGYYFDVSVKDALARNESRPPESRVPKAAFFATRKRLVPPTLAEGFHELFAVVVAANGAFQITPLT